ncbi:MAG TPA: MFS transporter, partial [Isosphaeraceae bacterium]|nr:MFS transporter [Isosphaeraceae bacterium]
MDHDLDQPRYKPANGPMPARERPPAALDLDKILPVTSSARPKWQGLKGLLVAQIFGQFNDQAFKQIVILLAMATVASEAEKQERTAFVSMMLLIPLTIISLPAGVLADRVSKRSVIIAMKVFEMILMLVGAAALYMQPHGGWISIGVLGLIGVQTAFFVPAKYGILPEILPHERLSAGNGLLEMTSNLAALAGIVGGGIILFAVGIHTWLGGVILAILSAFGLWASLTIPPVKAARAEGGVGKTARLAWESIHADRVLGLALLGQVFVWTIATMVPPVVLAYDASHLGLKDWQSGLPLAALGIGIGVGCLLAGKLSASKVEYGLLPLGALGLTLSALVFAAIGPGLYGTIVVMTFLGIFSGLLFVPLNALLQWRSPADRRGAVISMANLLVYGGMVLGTFLALVLARAGVSARGTFLAASIVLAGGF